MHPVILQVPIASIHNEWVGDEMKDEMKDEIKDEMKDEMRWDEMRWDEMRLWFNSISTNFIIIFSGLSKQMLMMIMIIHIISVKQLIGMSMHRNKQIHGDQHHNEHDTESDSTKDETMKWFDENWWWRGRRGRGRRRGGWRRGERVNWHLFVCFVLFCFV